MDRNYINAKLDAASARVAEYRDRLYVPGQRDEYQGFSETAHRLLEANKNLLFSELNGEAYSATDSIYRGFSEAPGLNDVSNVKAMDAIDISIMATMQSIIPYLAAERAMSKPVDLIYFQKLVNTNVAGGFPKTGMDVVNPFSPLSNLINLGKSGGAKTEEFEGAGADKELTFTTPIAKKSVTITATKGEGDDKITVVGRDKDGDGIIYWNRSGAADSATVDYNESKISIANAVTGFTFSVSFDVDKTSELDGKNTLKVKAKTEKVEVEAEPNRIILESSFEDNAYMNKMTYDLQNVGLSMDFGKRALRQLLDAYVHYIDLQVVAAAANTAVENGIGAKLDLTKYSLATSQASTKNDKINEFMLELDNALLKQSGKGPTAYFVDTDAARILANNPMNFTSNSNYNSYINGVIGTYRNIPVVRHNALDGSLGSGVAFVGVVHKTADGQAAPVVYAEYLPPYSVRPALNYNNPAQFSSGLFSQSKAQKIVQQLAAYGAITFANTSGSN